MTLPRLTYDQSQTVKVKAAVQNVGPVVCTYGGTGQQEAPIVVNDALDTLLDEI